MGAMTDKSNDEAIMTGAQLKAWREARRISAVGLAELLGISRYRLFDMENGFQRGSKKPAGIDKRTRLALAALSAGILDYDGTQVFGPPNEIVSLDPTLALGGSVVAPDPFADPEEDEPVQGDAA